MLLTLLVTTGLTGLYIAYSWFVTPRLIQPILASSRRPLLDLEEIQAEPPLSNRESAEEHLSDAPWAAAAKIQIPMAHGMLFANNWRALDDSQELFEFRPFAMIWNASGNDIPDSETTPKKAPLTLVSERGLVRFSTKFDPVNQKTGRVINGKLEGRITIKGDDGLSAAGRDLFFDEKAMELHSAEPFQFTYQQHSGTSENGVIVKLLPSTTPAKRDQLVSIGGVQRLLLRGHVEMDLVLNDSQMRVTCDEGFDFNLQSRNASFKINVNVVRPTGPSEADSLKCQYLDLIFHDDSAESNSAMSRARGDAPAVMPMVRSNGPTEHADLNDDLDRKSPVDQPRPSRTESVGRLTLKKLQATGSRAELESQSNGLSAYMTSLIYDVASRTARLSDAKSVIVQQFKNGTELRCPEITLTQNENGEIDTANGHGPGWVRRRKPDSDEIDFAAQWKSHFTLEPELDTGLSILKLHGKAIAKQTSADTGLSAETIKLWFERPRRTDNAAIDKEAEAVDTGNFRPRKVHAQDNVLAVSPQLRGRTQRLEVLFDEGSAKQPELAEQSPSRVRPAGKSNIDDLKPSDQKSSDKNAEPLELSADWIQAKVTWKASGNEAITTELSEVWTEGNVDIQQSHGDDSEPLHLTGQKLHLQNRGGNGQVVHVIGQPAVIRDRGFDIEGNDVFLDRLRNRTWIEGPGALRLPVKNDFDGRTFDSPSLLTIWWQERMAFDGQTATFFDGVKAALNDSRLQCQEMEVSLTNRFLFSGDQGKVPAAEVRQVVCKDGVEIDHSQYADKELVEIRRMQAAQVTLNQKSGETVAVGPGELALWRPGRGKRAALAPRATAQANRPLETEATNWEFTRVTFAGKTIGNIHERKSTFHDRVHIVYGPVSTPLTTIDPDNLPRDGGWMQCNSLTVLQLQDAETKKAHVELRAEGNAKLEGRSFFAQADSISFDESKELYTLRAKGSREVTIWRRATPGGDDDVVSAKSIWFIPSQNKLISDKTTGIRGSK